MESKVWPWLPDPMKDQSGEHYKRFEEVVGKVTSEIDRPSSQNVTLAAAAQEQQVH